MTPRLLILEQFNRLTFVKDRKGQSKFAQFALDLLPTVGANVSGDSGSTFAVKPLFQALNVNRLHGASAHARRDQWVKLRVFFFSEANPASVLS